MSKKFTLVILESPYSGDVEKNTRYAQLCMKDCLLRGEAPYASHLLYTQPNVLNDENPEERSLGIDAGLAWGQMAEKTVLYVDLGISKGMEYGIQNAKDNNRPIEIRNLSAELIEKMNNNLEFRPKRMMI